MARSAPDADLIDRARQAAGALAWTLAPGPMHRRFERRHPELAQRLARRPDVLLIHIPKTGGLSAVKALYDAEDSAHWTWAQWRRMNPVLFRNRLKFAVVRDPVARFLSAYDYLSAGGRTVRDAELRDRFIAPFAGPDAVVERLADADYREGVMHFWPQTRFVCDGRKVMVNRLAAFERLATELPALLGVAELPAVNVTPGARSGADRLSAASLETLRRVYADDLALHDLALSGRGDVFGVRLPGYGL